MDSLLRTCCSLLLPSSILHFQKKWGWESMQLNLASTYLQNQGPVGPEERDRWGGKVESGDMKPSLLQCTAGGVRCGDKWLTEPMFGQQSWWGKWASCFFNLHSLQTTLSSAKWAKESQHHGNEIPQHPSPHSIQCPEHQSSEDFSLMPLKSPLQ